MAICPHTLLKTTVYSDAPLSGLWPALPQGGEPCVMHISILRLCSRQFAHLASISQSKTYPKWWAITTPYPAVRVCRRRRLRGAASACTLVLKPPCTAKPNTKNPSYFLFRLRTPDSKLRPNDAQFALDPRPLTFDPAPMKHHPLTASGAAAHKKPFLFPLQTSNSRLQTPHQ